MMSWKNKHVIVTGGAGFIGSALVKKLLSCGAEVKVIDNLWRGSLDNLKGENGADIFDIKNNFFNVDLTDYSACQRHLREADFVYHLADVVAGINFVFSNEMFVYHQNILINTNALAACLENGIKNYIYVGTACSYPKHLQMSEEVVRLREDQTYPAEPESSYGWSKLMGEYEAMIAEKEGRMNVGLLRFHNVFGPGSVFTHEKSQVLPSLARKAIMYPEEKFIVWGDGSQYRDFVFIDDIIDALILVAEKGMGKGLIQIGSEQATTIRQAAETIVRISGKNIPIEYDTNGPQGDRGRIADCSKAREILGWRPKVSFEQGLSALYLWIKGQIKK